MRAPDIAPVGATRLPNHAGLLLALLVAAAFAIRAGSFGNSVIQVDEQFYIFVGERILRGEVPFVDIWDRKPVGLFLLFAGIRLLGGNGILEYQILATLCAGATAFLVVRMAQRFAPLRAAVLAGICYLLWLSVLGGEGGQAPVFYNLPVAAAASLTLAAISRPVLDRRALVYGSTAMLLCGVTLQIKYSVVFESIFFGVTLLWHAWRSGTGWARLVLLAAFWNVLGLLPTVAAYVYYWQIGHAETFIYANFVSVLDRRSAPIGVTLERLLKLVALSSPLLACAIASRWVSAQPRRDETAFNFASAWAVAAFAGILLFGTYYDHYALAMLAPVTTAAAPGLADFRTGIAVVARQRAYLWPFLIFVPMFGGIAQYAVVASHERARGTGPEIAAMAQWLNARLRPGECFYLFDGEPILHYLAGDCYPTRWVFPDHLQNSVEDGAIGIDPLVEVRRIMERRPRFVVTSKEPQDDMNWRTWNYVQDEFRKHYRVAFRVRVGSGYRQVMERRSSPPVT